MIRAVFFDAVGTLIEPHPSAIDIYCTIGQRHGCRLNREEIGKRFRSAFRSEDDKDRRADWRTDEAREEQRWRIIVETVLDDVRDTSSCFRELWDHFAKPDSWRCLEGVGAVLTELAQRGHVLGMASNFDARLRRVAEGLPELRPLRHLIVSSEVGWRKPASGFFAAVIRAAAVDASRILFIGDDPINDGEGARAAGMSVLLLDAPISLQNVVSRLSASDKQGYSPR